MSKDKYQIPIKSYFICLTVLLHDLKCFDEELSEEIKDAKSVAHKMRNTRNVFVSLHNLKDSMSRIRVNGDEQFISETRALRRELDFIVHIRNKGVGHLDLALLERAAQWVPELFFKETHDNDDYLTFLSYKALMESAINSYVNGEGEQKIFKTEIDFLYPPNAEQFFDFLSMIVKQSISWLEKAREIIKSEINFHLVEEMKEIFTIAGKTNFNLKDESDFTFSEVEMKNTITSAIEKMREMGADDRVIEFLENEVFK